MLSLKKVYGLIEKVCWVSLKGVLGLSKEALDRVKRRRGAVACQRSPPCRAVSRFDEVSNSNAHSLKAEKNCMGTGHTISLLRPLSWIATRHRSHASQNCS